MRIELSSVGKLEVACFGNNDHQTRPLFNILQSVVVKDSAYHPGYFRKYNTAIGSKLIVAFWGYALFSF